ncbi:YdcF family protein [Magnetospirillum sp. SS-4]|uniref:YdcF family protein n=1 Tax=Magnetospirillum sp. SS-4 TaxID=2681465 RepID=UPI0013820BAC|nr:YdcF family protein [Magnetospirillum sp. SS-4]CAA7624473.1 conserved hypothetical protein [Magnetospirillum sp. SS-4]
MFVISKLVGALTEPVTILVLVMGLCWMLLRSRRFARAGRRLMGATLAVVLALAVFPVESVMMTALENRFPPPASMPERVDGIIVLGGGINPVISAARGRVALNSAASRLTALIPLARRYPEARLIFTGGSGALLSQEIKEATYVKDFYMEIGFDPDRIVFEDQSRNTHENAVLSKEIMAPNPGETWLLVTSAFHMPRAVGCFRAAGWPVVAYPVDYATTGRGEGGLSDLRFSVAAGLGGLRTVAHEMLGLVGYRLLGWTESVFPAP